MLSETTGRLEMSLTSSQRMHSASVRNIAARVNSRVTSAEQIVRETLARAEAYQEVQPAAWISRVPEEQLYEEARQIDQRIASGESLPLAGVPVAVKDNIDVAGLETTAACPAFAYLAEASAPVVKQLLEAGALVVGKTNLDQFATGLVGTRSPYGSLGCVFNREYISGGSSSGSAVLVAASVVPLALGSDTAGSGRVPAAFNHLLGFKPTRGRWSSRGIVPACRSLDCVSAFTRNAEDAALVDYVVGRFDPQDAYARRAPPASASRQHFCVGVPTPGQLQDLASPDERAYRVARERLKRAGGTLLEVDVAPLLEAARLLYEGPWVAERTEALETLLDTHPGAIHPVVRTIIQAGKGISGVDTFRGLHALQAHARGVDALWKCVDVLALPTTPTIYRRTEVLAEPYGLNAILGRYTNFVNLLDMTAVSVPAGFRDNATGIGLSLIGPAWSDTRLLEIAARYANTSAPYAVPELDTRGNPARVQLAVVGAHLSGMPLHSELSSRAARLVRTTCTAPLYRLFALRGETPPKPGLVHCGEGGHGIELEVYELEVSAFGSFAADVPPPLAIGTVILQDGTGVRGFVCEPRALNGALDITHHGGWRAYLAYERGSLS
jgi:allophanate hydrolase